MRNLDTLDDVVNALAEYAYKNQLILFLGTGFSKAVMGYDQDARKHYDETKAEAVASWVELLSKCRAELRLPAKEFDSKGAIDCPYEASAIAHELVAHSPSMTDANAVKFLKETICELVDWYPSAKQVVAFQKLFHDIKPSLIITTNYDEVIETILHKMYYSFGPTNILTGLPTDVVPIYHLHGSRQNPDEIVVTREDYIAALRPMTYRQSRLASLLKENAVLYIGYSRSDINVLSALDIAKNAYKDVVHNTDNLHIQLVYQKGVYNWEWARGCSDLYQLQGSDIYEFLDKLAVASVQYRKERDNELNQFAKGYQQILDFPSKSASKVLSGKRDKFSEIIAKDVAKIEVGGLAATRLRGRLIVMIQKFYEGVKRDTYQAGNFEAYAYCLFILIELLVNMEKLGLNSFFFDFVATELENIAQYIGPQKGQSWAAYDSLQTGWGRIPEAVIVALKKSALRHNRIGTLDLIKRIGAASKLGLK